MAVAQPLDVAARRGADAVREQLTRRQSDPGGIAFRTLIQLATLLALVILAVLIATVVMDGMPVLTERGADFLTGTIGTQPGESGVFQGIQGSFWIAVSVVLLAFPLGIAAGIYLEEYARRTWFTKVVDIAIRNLAGVPSIVYGILGFALFAKALGSLTGPELDVGGSLLAAGLTISVLVLPIVIITAAEAIRAVPDSLREAGFGVGATRWEVVRHHVLPYAAPGILTGTVLALARALGEAAPLILLGAVTGRIGQEHDLLDLSQLQERFTALPIVITDWSKSFVPEFRDANAPAAIVVMLSVVLLFNLAAILLRNRYEKKRQG